MRKESLLNTDRNRPAREGRQRATLLARSLASLACGATALAIASCQNQEGRSEHPVSRASSGAAASTGGFPVVNAETAVEGFALYRQHCATCHDNPTGPTPSRQTLGGFPRERIYAALTTGPMQPMATALDDRQKRLLAVTLPQEKPFAEPKLSANMCRPGMPPAGGDSSDWPGWSPGLANTRFQPNSGLSADLVPRLRLKWAFAYPGGVGGLPVVSQGRLFSASATGTVFALDARSGCTLWTAKVPAEVRGAPVAGARTAGGGEAAVFVADAEGHVVAFDAARGSRLWSTPLFKEKGHRVSGSPVLYGGRLYVPLAAFEIPLAPAPTYPCCKARGGLAVLNATTGKLIWKADVIAEPLKPRKANSAGTPNFGPAGASVWSAPTIDPKRGLVYVTTGNAYTEPMPDGADALVAFDLRTGKRRWASATLGADAWLAGCDKQPHPNCPKHLGPDSDLGMPPALVTLPDGRDVLVAGSKGGMVYAFDPDHDGKILWKTHLARPNPLGSLIFGSAIEGGKAYFPISYDDPEGGLAAIDLATGKLVWRKAAPAPACAWGADFCSAAQRSPPAAIPGIVFAGSNDAHIRAYSRTDGAIVWSFDTGRTVNAVNGVPARGGAMGRGGQTIAGGMLYVNAGAGIGRSGNALMAFSVDGR